MFLIRIGSYYAKWNDHTQLFDAMGMPHWATFYSTLEDAETAAKDCARNWPDAKVEVVPSAKADTGSNVSIQFI